MSDMNKERHTRRSAPARELNRVAVTTRFFRGSTAPIDTSGVSTIATSFGGAVRIAARPKCAANPFALFVLSRGDKGPAPPSTETRPREMEEVEAASEERRVTDAEEVEGGGEGQALAAGGRLACDGACAGGREWARWREGVRAETERAVGVVVVGLGPLEVQDDRLSRALRSDMLGNDLVDDK
jgi:hypothetical protein